MTRVATSFVVALVICLAAPVFAQFEDESVQAFLAADANGDEVLSQPEFRVFIQQMAAAGAPMSRRIQTLGVYGIAFGRTDADGDGLLTPGELRAADRANR